MPWGFDGKEVVVVSDKSVAYLGCIDPHHIEGDMDEIAASGCTSIVLTVNESDWNYYRKARKAIMEAARARGLKVYLNMHGFGIFASSWPSSSYLLERPEACQLFNTGRRTTLACPNHEGFSAWLKDRIKEVVEEFGPDGMFWDEPRFQDSEGWPQEWACRCESCRRAFETKYGKPLPEEVSPEVLEFRQESLLRFLKEVIKVGKEVGGGESVLCLMPWDRTGREPKLSPGWYGVVDWEPFVEIPELDVFSTDPYWIHCQPFEYFESNVKEAVRLAGRYGKKCQIWVQAVWIPPGKEAEVRRSLLAAAEMGADMLAVWSFRGEPGSHVLDLGGDTELIWEMVKEAYRSL